MTEIVLANGTIVTMNNEREIITDGAVAISDGRIKAVGATNNVATDSDPDRIIDANGGIVLPGLISSHVHVSDIFLRGLTNDSHLFDWLYNVRRPGIDAYTTADHAYASALYCREAISSGVTTFVENATATGSGYSEDVIDRKAAVYDTAGIRSIYAQTFSDREPTDEFREYIEGITSREPTVDHVGFRTEPTDEALDSMAELLDTYHGENEGRLSIWPAGSITWNCTQEGLRRIYELAEEYDVMTTLHVAESPEEESGLQSSVEYLDTAGYLGEHTLLGHCTHISPSDLRRIKQTDTRVAHNPVSNLGLGMGVAPVPRMLNAGVTVSIGTDDTSVNNTVNMLEDVRIAALIHKGHSQDAGVITAEKVLEMVTIDAARAIGRGDELGSLEVGKLADIIVIDGDGANSIPCHNIPGFVVYQSQKSDIETVLCDGRVLLAPGQDEVLGEEFPDLYQEAETRADDIVERAGLTGFQNREWTAVPAQPH